MAWHGIDAGCLTELAFRCVSANAIRVNTIVRQMVITYAINDPPPPNFYRLHTSQNQHASRPSDAS